MDSLESNESALGHQPLPPSTSSASVIYPGGVTRRPIATYSPMDSGYQTDSPTPAAANSVSCTPPPPPGTFRPVSPASSLRHAATQTPQTEPSLDQPPARQQPPLLLSQQSTGFRPASAPVYDLPDGVGDVAGGAFGGGDDLDSEFDEEVYRTSVVQILQPLPDLLQLQRSSDTAAEAVRLRTRSVPVPDFASRQERVALLLREIGDQYNLSRGQSPAAAAASSGGRASLQMFSHTRRDRSYSLRISDDAAQTIRQEVVVENWRHSILGWVAQMARTLSGANIALDDAECDDADGDREAA